MAAAFARHLARAPRATRAPIVWRPPCGWPRCFSGPSVEELKGAVQGLKGPDEQREVAIAAVKACTRNSDDMEKLVSMLEPSQARALGVAAMSRHFGTDFSADFQGADEDRSGDINKTEFKRYLSRIVKDKVDGEGDAPTSRQTMLFCLNSAIPFVVFGMLDNSIMLLGGDVVDDLVGSYFHLSTLACAAVANTFADVLGISIGNTVEALTVKLGLPEAHLTQAQSQMPKIRRLGILSGSAGILIGCCIGMTPLLFMDPERKALKEAFAKVDAEGAGALEAPRLRRVLLSAGLEAVDDDALAAALRDLGIGRSGRVSCQEFLDNFKKLKEVLEAK